MGQLMVLGLSGIDIIVSIDDGVGDIMVGTSQDIDKMETLFHVTGHAL